MTREIAMDIINNPEAFVNEIIRNHGQDSMQYIMAIAMVREVNNQLKEVQL